MKERPPRNHCVSKPLKNILRELKDQLQKDSESVLTVGRGEVVTVRVPTHEEGAYLFWAFATDSYDLGFGVYFEWSDVKTNQVKAFS